MRPNTGYAMLHRLRICPAKHKHRATQSSPNTQGTWTHRSEQKWGKKFRGESKGRTIKNIQGDRSCSQNNKLNGVQEEEQ